MRWTISGKAVLVAAGLAVGAGPAMALDDVSLRLNWVLGGTNLAWFVGIERGYFEEEGINLTVGEGRGSMTTAQLVAAGEDHFGMADGASVIQAVDREMPIKAVMSLRNLSGFAVLYLADSGIETLKDLEGRRVAVTAGDALTQQWPAVVGANDLDGDAVLLTYMDASAKPVALMEGRVDAMLGNYVDQGVILEQQGFDVDWFAFAEHGVNTVSMSLVARTDFIEGNEDLVRRFVRAASRSWEAYREDPEAAVDAAMRHKPEMNRDVAYNQTLGNITLMDSPYTEGRVFGWGAEEDWGNTLRVLQEIERLQRDLPLSAYYTNEFVPES
jgi:NitT/TauT family transport system substrate-binding protein